MTSVIHTFTGTSRPNDVVWSDEVVGAEPSWSVSSAPPSLVV